MTPVLDPGPVTGHVYVSAVTASAIVGARRGRIREFADRHNVRVQQVTGQHARYRLADLLRAAAESEAVSA